jgi:hypothetical protein
MNQAFGSRVKNKRVFADENLFVCKRERIKNKQLVWEAVENVLNFV